MLLGCCVAMMPHMLIFSIDVQSLKWQNPSIEACNHLIEGLQTNICDHLIEECWMDIHDCSILFD